jgi:hypothetical protein
MSENFRLQTWWQAIESLAVPITALILPFIISEMRPAALVRRFGKLGEIRVYMWEGFEEQVDERARGSVRGSMEVYLGDLRRELEVSDLGDTGKVPSIELV